MTEKKDIFWFVSELHGAQMVYLHVLIATEKPPAVFLDVYCGLDINFSLLNKNRHLNQQSIIIFHNCLYANKQKCPCDHVEFNESMPFELRFVIAQIDPCIKTGRVGWIRQFRANVFSNISISERAAGKNEMAMCSVRRLKCFLTH